MIDYIERVILICKAANQQIYDSNVNDFEQIKKKPTTNNKHQRQQFSSFGEFS